MASDEKKMPEGTMNPAEEAVKAEHGAKEGYAGGGYGEKPKKPEGYGAGRPPMGGPGGYGAGRPPMGGPGGYGAGRLPMGGPQGGPPQVQWMPVVVYIPVYAGQQPSGFPMGGFPMGGPQMFGPPMGGPGMPPMMNQPPMGRPPMPPMGKGGYGEKMHGKEGYGGKPHGKEGYAGGGYAGKDDKNTTED